ncbi:MAG: dihydroorotase [Candidatus Omnitrophica bacterium]|nr:dihydroorotase [Candidatus Omnitrophota bacterium]
MSILIKSGRVIDPKNKFDAVSDVLVENGKILKIAKSINADAAEKIDAKGMIVAPGLIDMHTHVRQPGREDAEDFHSAQVAAAKGGFSSITAMPNTNPACDNRGIVEYIISEAGKAGIANIFPIGAITRERKGEDLAEIADMKDAGVVAVSDDGCSVKNAQLMRKALEYSKMFNVLVISHCEDLDLSQKGVMNEGLISTVLGLKGMPSISEFSFVQRDIELAQLTGARLHIAHVSTKESVAIIKQAKKIGIDITCETCPHYFTLTDEAVKTFDTNTKVNPPLRTKEDVSAIIEGLKDGTIDVIATDHAPHTEADKDVEFDAAPSGIIGLETALALSIAELIDKKILSYDEVIKKMSFNPSNILGLTQKGSLSQGAAADIVVINPDKKWVFAKEQIASKSKNSPFIGRAFKGCAVITICNGKIVYRI